MEFLLDTHDWQHANSFDRLLVVQAEQRSLTFVTADVAMRGYAGAAQLWAAA